MHRNMIMDKAQHSDRQEPTACGSAISPGIGDPAQRQHAAGKEAPEIIAGH
jgi:hypothetical protein